MEGKEKMLSDWTTVLISIFRADTGEVDVNHTKNSDDEVTGIAGEMILTFNDSLPKKFVKQGAKAIELAVKQAEEAVNSEGEITSKQKVIIEWLEVRNAMVRAENGEMKVTRHSNDNVPGGGVVAVSVEWMLDFGAPMPQLVTEEEKELIEEAQPK